MMPPTDVRAVVDDLLGSALPGARASIEHPPQLARVTAEREVVERIVRGVISLDAAQLGEGGRLVVNLSNMVVEPDDDGDSSPHLPAGEYVGVSVIVRHPPSAPEAAVRRTDTGWGLPAPELDELVRSVDGVAYRRADSPAEVSFTVLLPALPLAS